IGRFIAKSGDEQEVISIPHGSIGSVGRRTFFDDQMGEYLAEYDDWEAFLLELHEEDTPRLSMLERAQLMDGADPGSVVIFKPEVFRLILKGKVLKAVLSERPPAFVFKMTNEFLKGADGAEVGGHGISVKFHPALEHRTDANGCLQRTEMVGDELLLDFL